MTFRNFIAYSAFALLAVVTGAEKVEAQEFMSQQELLATIPGATLYGVSSQDGKTKWAQAYGKGRKKGKIAGVFGKDKYQAKWWVKDDMWCEDWGSDKGCWKMVRDGDKQLQAYKEGTKKVKYPWNIK